jgi:hypothetical protein
VFVRSLGPIDGVDVSVRGLAPSTTYTLFLTDASGAPSSASWPLATVITDAHGSQPLVEAVTPAPLPRGAPAEGRRFVLVRGTTTEGPVALSAAVTLGGLPR